MAESKTPAQAIGELTSVIEAQMAPEDLASLDMSPEDLAREIKHPLAQGMIATLLEREKTAPQEGDLAPDFSLPWLTPRTGGDAGERVTLSEHFGNRPVALVFGSYT